MQQGPEGLNIGRSSLEEKMSDRLRLVVIDDDGGVLRALSMLLEAIGFSVKSFTSPTEAITYIQEASDVDVVVTDLRMPVVSGEGVVRAVREFSASLPCIVMSGHATPADVDILTKCGMNAFLPKPFTPDLFKKTVAAVAGSQSNEQR